MKMAITTAESSIVRKEEQRIPCVVLIGRGENGEYLKYRIPFYPYLYLLENDWLKLEGVNLKKYVKEALGVKTRSINKRILTKLVLYDSKQITELLHLLRKHFKGEFPRGESIFTLEADLSRSDLLGLRYLIDNNIKTGVEIEDNTVTPIEFTYPLRIWLIDFEAYNTKVASRGPKPNEPIIMVSFYDTYTNELYTLYTKNSKWDKQPIFYSMTKNHRILVFDTELLLLEKLTQLVNSMNPDLISAWNLDRYDIIKWKQRIDAYKHLGLKVTDLSPIKSLVGKSKPIRIKGRILFDQMKALKRFTDAELRSYSLGAVAKEEELNIEKVEFKGTMANAWDNSPVVVFRRNVNDVLIMKALEDRYELIETFNDLRKEFGCLFHEVLMNYRVLDTALMRMVNGKIALNTSKRGKTQKEKLLGAIVIKPKPGNYKNILQLDFSREYPNIIRYFNISPETYRVNSKKACYSISYKDMSFKFIKKPLGLLPQLIDYFFKKRDEYEVEYNKALKDKDEVKSKMWYRRIFNIKKMTNAIYGVMDFPIFRLSRKECTQATAIIGRIAIEKLRGLAREKNYEVVYGDTDSIFIQLKSKSKKELLDESKCLQEYLNTKLSKFFIEQYNIKKAPSELGIKKIYFNFNLFAKKSYAGKYVWDEKKGYKEGYDFKGIEIVRSDSSDLEKLVLENMLKFNLNNKLEEAKQYWAVIVKQFLHNRFTSIQLAYPLQIVKPYRYYKPRVPAHIRAALYSNKYLNTDFTPGDKPRRLPIKSKEKFKVKIGKDKFIFRLKDISIDEDMELPKWIIRSIDKDRIFSRLKSKVDRVMKLNPKEKQIRLV